MNDIDRRPFVTVTRGLRGYFAVLMHYNTEDLNNGFWEPWQSSDSSFIARDHAIEDGKEWAAAENVEFRL